MIKASITAGTKEEDIPKGEVLKDMEETPFLWLEQVE